jgi:hypothetical protein
MPAIMFFFFFFFFFAFYFKKFDGEVCDVESSFKFFIN